MSQAAGILRVPRPFDFPQGGIAKMSGKDILAIVYGFACPLKCDFCCHPVERYGKAKFTVDETVGLIREAEAIPSIGRIGFTGGDPFVYYPEIASILERSRGSRLPFRIVTAAYWARSKEVALEKLRPLAGSGLRELRISADPSHQEFVPPAYVRNAVEAARELGLDVRIYSVFWEAPAAPLAGLDLPEEIGVRVSRVSPVGRGEVAARERSAGEEASWGGCARSPDLFEISVYPDGEVYPCASAGFNQRAKLSFGNFRREPLAEILRRMREDRYTRIVMNQGFSAIYELARVRFPEIHARLPGRSPDLSACQLCARIHSDPELLALLDPVLRYVGRMRQEMIVLEREQLGALVVPVGA